MRLQSYLTALIWVSLLLATSLSLTIRANETATSLFEDYQAALYQIRIIEKESGNKSAIGSGFHIFHNSLPSTEAWLGTNYHVISEYIYFPDKYRIEYLGSDGETGSLELIDFDVINDLAILKLPEDKVTTPALLLANEQPTQGSAIFSLGNPRDLGMSVVPGTYNGIKTTSYHKRIHVTSAINPGMSGGPAVNQNGEIIGVNVATGGNQIGFLVPLDKLKQLIDKATQAALSPEQYKAHIGEQLLDTQAEFMRAFTKDAWPQTKLGKAIIPGQVNKYLSCWGNSNAKQEKTKFLSIQNRCRTDEAIYVNNSLRTGNLEMEFEWVSSDQLNSHKFYHFLSRSTAAARAGNNAGKADVTNYQCQHDILSNRNQVSNKSVLCIRAYKDFPELYDALYIAVSLDFEQQSLISHFTLAGVTQKSIMDFTALFMESLAWQ